MVTGHGVGFGMDSSLLALSFKTQPRLRLAINGPFSIRSVIPIYSSV
jgi:hypothetical protein